MAGVPIHLRLLGRPHAERDAQDVELPAKAWALLGYLAASPAPQPRERILGLLWGESAEEAARKNLRNTLWTIRKQLGEDAIAAQGDSLTLGPDVSIDAPQLETDPLNDPAVLLERYRGPFLDGLSLTEAPEFELWLSAARESLQQAFLRRVGDALAALSERGEWGEVAALARGTLRHDPLNEALHRSLMTALAEQGQRAEALRHYDALAQALQAELAVPPSPETTSLRDALARDTGQRLPRAPRRASAAPPESPLRFVGRDAERAALDAELQAARGGRARAVLITGELGIGKSRLWREWSRDLPTDCRALEARCVEAASGLPFAPLVELFSAHSCVDDLLHGPSSLADVWLAEVARLLPQLRAEAPRLPSPAALPPEEERRRVFEAFAQVLLALDARPLVVFVDDVHWADRATLDWLGYLVHRLRAEPLLLVIAYRPEDAPPALVHQAAAWAREGVMRRISLPRLAPEETAQLIGALGVPPALAHRLQARSAGNPYFLLELSQQAGEPEGAGLSPALADLVRSRLERLSEGARSVAQAAAVLEPELDLPLLVSMTGRSEDETLDALDELLALGVLVERSRRLEFNHPILPAVVRSSLSAPRSAVLNRRAAQILMTARGELPNAVAGFIADHLAAAGDAPEAARYADLAAEHAQSLAALDDAVRFRQRAQELAPSAARNLRLGDALLRAGRLPAAREAFAAALAEAERTGDRTVAARAALGMGESFISSGWADEVLHWAEQALRYLEAEGDPAAHVRAHFLLGVGQLRRGGRYLEQAEADLVESVRIAQQDSVNDWPMAQFELANARAERGDLRGAVELYAQTADLAEQAGDPNQRVLALNNLAYHLMLLGEMAEAETRSDEAVRLADAFGLTLSREYLYSTRGEICLAEGQWHEAERWIEMSLAASKEHNNVAHVAKCRANMARAARGRGDLDTALILMEEAAEVAAPVTARFMQAQIDLWLSEIYLARGERTAASQVLARGEERLKDSHYQGLLESARRLREALR
jgi:DNA-binding SARP family transcriptional activator/tetratricopeptide (TPR) repeat protein